MTTISRRTSRARRSWITLAATAALGLVPALAQADDRLWTLPDHGDAPFATGRMAATADEADAFAVPVFGLPADDADRDDDGLVAPLFLQTVVNPADKAAGRSRSATRPADERVGTNPFANRKASWEMAPVDVVGEKEAELREEDKIGPYAQPRWTARRFTPGTRVYVRPPGTIEFEYWLRPTITKGGDTEIRTLYEISVGLPYRFQLDMYLRTDSDGDGSETEVGQQLELRWALADWNVIWGNPTLYLEWVQKDASPDQIEAKILLGGEIAPRWHWGSNLVAELELGGEREYEFQFTGGVTYAVIDSTFSVGGEFIAAFTSTSDNRDSYETSILVGPTIQWKPIEQLRIEFAPLVGVTPESPDFRAYLNVGWEF